MTNTILMDASFNRKLKDYCKERIDASMCLYQQNLITLAEYLEGVEAFQELYKRCYKVESDLIDSTEPYSEERYRLLGELYK